MVTGFAITDRNRSGGIGIHSPLSLLKRGRLRDPIARRPLPLDSSRQRGVAAAGGAKSLRSDFNYIISSPLMLNCSDCSLNHEVINAFPSYYRHHDLEIYRSDLAIGRMDQHVGRTAPSGASL